MDWPFVFMVTLGWIVSGGIMYLVYGLGKSLCRDAFSGEEEDDAFSGEEEGNQPRIPLWRQWLSGVAAVGMGFPIFGFFFDYRGANVETWDHLLGIFFATAIAFSVGWHDEYGRRKKMK